MRSLGAVGNSCGHSPPPVLMAETQLRLALASDISRATGVYLDTKGASSPSMWESEHDRFSSLWMALVRKRVSHELEASPSKLGVCGYMDDPDGDGTTRSRGRLSRCCIVESGDAAPLL
ncbi:hypothetical protein SNOG_07832 [Parastagonospora nodorum SN15]|uniref:Uncharacterized protein n=1 Tax=Phaeosphaeria nodorum (strain SN15 / ATCC MYA-4574 / FGSC 10173) TaxID=321614 RepID=Q0UK82_PHANO|nr:hypothetical protein SNOG_07832 [Parastagonospora nodorum SN15]EAT85298.1 hypothetical protein SNOG_07832 [Parastagonospora nodorum SN15]